ncbi:ABC transporter permease [Oryzobacter telluris]|uniref:ABC transporter permease n=1 Tax=Oryzobacter telluris TaxID=3149179 RepID=UPI00370DCB93
MTRIRAVWGRREILWTLVQRDLRVRYSRSILGYVWTVLDPLLMAAVYFVVFTYVFNAKRVADTPYFLYLLSGLLGWQWFTASVTDTTKSLIQEARLVRSTNLPREVWVIRCVVAKGVEYLLSLPILVGFVIYYLVIGQVHLDWELVLFPLGLVLQFVLLVGLGLVLAPITVLATDMQRVVRIVLRFLFYLSPVLYGAHSVPDGLRWVLALNPLNGVLSLYRGGLFERGVNWVDVGAATVISVALVAVGFWVFARLERSVLKEI